MVLPNSSSGPCISPTPGTQWTQGEVQSSVPCGGCRLPLPPQPPVKRLLWASHGSERAWLRVRASQEVRREQKGLESEQEERGGPGKEGEGKRWGAPALSVQLPRPVRAPLCAPRFSTPSSPGPGQWLQIRGCERNLCAALGASREEGRSGRPDRGRSSLHPVGALQRGPSEPSQAEVHGWPLYPERKSPQMWLRAPSGRGEPQLWVPAAGEKGARVEGSQGTLPAATTGPSASL